MSIDSNLLVCLDSGLSGYQPADDALGHYLGRMACGRSIVWGTSGVFEDKESESRARISGLQGEIRTA